MTAGFELGSFDIGANAYH